MDVHGAVTRIAHAAADLALGSACAGCGAHPGLLCADCRGVLLGASATVTGLPGFRGLGLAGAAGYGGSVRAAIIDHKERGRLPLARPLGDALAISVTALLASPHACGHRGDRPVAVVPVPSTRAAVRRRGHDPVLRSARRAASTLRRAGQLSTVVTALRHVRRVEDQAGLGRHAREDNLRGSLTVRRAAERVLRGRCIVLADDIVTTGATLRECARALEAAGLAPCGAAVVAVAA